MIYHKTYSRKLEDNFIIDYSSKPDLRASRTRTEALSAYKTSNKNLIFI